MITREEFRKIVDQTKLQFADEKYESFTVQIQEMTKFADELQSVDTEGVEPTYYGNAIMNVMREDEPIPSDHTEDLLANAPERKEDFIQVPAILDVEEGV